MDFLQTYRGKRVFITGHTGFKGAWLSQFLLELGAEVCGYSIDIPTEPSLFKVLGLENKLIHRIGDIRNLEEMHRAMNEFQPQFVFHLAAQPLVRSSYEDPKTTFDTNVGGTVNVLECLRRIPSIEVGVLVATDKCYENLEQAQPFTETDRLGGKDPYSASKACAEIAFHSYYQSFFSQQDRVRVGSARAGNVIGGGDWAKDRLVPDCVRSWSQGQRVQVRNPHSTRPWQHVLDPLGGYLLLGEELFKRNFQVVGGSFNFGPSDGVSAPVQSLLQEMGKFWNKAEWKFEETPMGSMKEAVQLRLDCKKSETVLNWRATFSFVETVAKTIGWYRTYYEGHEDMRRYTLSQIHYYFAAAKVLSARSNAKTLNTEYRDEATV